MKGNSQKTGRHTDRQTNKVPLLHLAQLHLLSVQYHIILVYWCSWLNGTHKTIANIRLTNTVINSQYVSLFGCKYLWYTHNRNTNTNQKASKAQQFIFENTEMISGE